MRNGMTSSVVREPGLVDSSSPTHFPTRTTTKRRKSPIGRLVLHEMENGNELSAKKVEVEVVAGAGDQNEAEVGAEAAGEELPTPGATNKQIAGLGPKMTRIFGMWVVPRCNFDGTNLVPCSIYNKDSFLLLGFMEARSKKFLPKTTTLPILETM